MVQHKVSNASSFSMKCVKFCCGCILLVIADTLTYVSFYYKWSKATNSNHVHLTTDDFILSVTKKYTLKTV